MEHRFTWVETHKQLATKLLEYRNDQQKLINILQDIDIDALADKPSKNESTNLCEIDPFTFFCYIYKHGEERNLEILRQIAEIFSVTIPEDILGVPSVNPQKVWLFPYKYDRNNNEINRLWELYLAVLNNQVSNIMFNDILTIKNIGKAKLTQALFMVNPEQFFPVNKISIPYLENNLNINSNFNDYDTYIVLLDEIKNKTIDPFYQISYDAWTWNQSLKRKVGSSENKKYWVYSPGEQAYLWDDVSKNNIIVLGWDYIGDLNRYHNKNEIKEAIQKKLPDKIPRHSTNANFDFKFNMSIGDMVFVKKGQNECLGCGVIQSDYFYDDSRDEYKKCRNIKWITKGLWKTKANLGIKTLTDITNNIDLINKLNELLGITSHNHIYNTEKHIMNTYPLNVIFYGPPGTGKTYHSILRAAEIVENKTIKNYQEAKEIFNKNLHDQIEFITFHQNYSYEDFIQGLRPDIDNASNSLYFIKKDGIFKKIADRAYKNLKSLTNENVLLPFDEILIDYLQPLSIGNEIEVKMKMTSYFIYDATDQTIYFKKNNGNNQHSISINTLKKMYEEGINTVIKGGLAPYYNPLLNILLEKGKQKNISSDVKIRKNYVLIIDEINRANISRVFGELITLIEVDKRFDIYSKQDNDRLTIEATLPSGDKFVVPSNLYIIGTMNTADKSIALLDIALRRRFEFEPMYPIYSISHNGKEQLVNNSEILSIINKQIIKLKGYDFQIGHSYFMDNSLDFIDMMNKKIIPLLLEYFMNDEKEVINILKQANLTIDDNWPIRIK